jgi:hypothetical protein
VQRCEALPVNPNAAKGFSTKRLLRAEEKGRNRYKAPHKPPLNAESPEKDSIRQEAGGGEGGRGEEGER